MENDKRALMLFTSRLLLYPSDDFFKEIKELAILVTEHDPSEELLGLVKTAITSFNDNTLFELRKLYVATFDLKEKNGLYLTAHELGDSPKRGGALIKLQKMINEAGFERMDGELADFIPMLLEFLAVAPDSAGSQQVIRRLAFPIQKIHSHLSSENPYSFVFSILEKIFPIPTSEEIRKIEFEKEEADLEELPYPIFYQS